MIRGFKGSFGDIRVIPELEKMPRLLEFAQSPVGKLALTVVLASGLWCLGVGHFFLVTICTLFPTFFPGRRLSWLLGANVYCWVFWSSAFSAGPSFPYDDWVTILVSRRGIEFSLGYIGFNAMVAILVLSILCLVARFTNPRAWKTESLLLLFLGLIFGLLFVAHLVRFQNFMFMTFWATALFLSRTVFYYLFSQTQKGVRGFESESVTFFTFIPFWTLLGYQAGPIPIGHAPLVESAAKDARALATLQLKAIKLLLWTNLLCWSADLVSGFIVDLPATTAHPFLLLTSWLPSMHLANFTVMGLTQFNQLQIQLQMPWYKIYLGTMASVLHLVSGNLWGELGAMVAVVRFCGIYAPRPIYRPLEATSFTDFFRRMMYFYSQILTRIFYFPIAGLSRHWLLPASMRKFCCVFLAVFIGALCIHFLRFSQVYLHAGFWGVLQTQAERSPYYFALALSCSVSSILPRNNGLQERYGWPAQLARVLFYLGIYLFCQTLDLMGVEESLLNRFVFIKSIFGLS